jgi:SAM-dependent methyltransferase
VLVRAALTELEAELYALTHRGNPGDAAFYARQCAGADGVLELGVGYGRLLPALAASGARVVGLDREASLLRAARGKLRVLPRAQQRRVQLLLGDMQSFALERSFERILLPYNALYCLLGRRALASCLRCVRAHLAPGGRFVFDVWSADAFQRHLRSGAGSAAHRDDVEALVRFQHRGQTWDVFERSRLRAARQRLDVEYTYVSRERGTRVTIPIAQRFASSAELGELLGRAGLRLRARWADFSGKRFGPGAELLVAVASL